MERLTHPTVRIRSRLSSTSFDTSLKQPLHAHTYLHMYVCIGISIYMRTCRYKLALARVWVMPCGVESRPPGQRRGEETREEEREVRCHVRNLPTNVHKSLSLCTHVLGCGTSCRLRRQLGGRLGFRKETFVWRYSVGRSVAPTHAGMGEAKYSVWGSPFLSTHANVCHVCI